VTLGALPKKAAWPKGQEAGETEQQVKAQANSAKHSTSSRTDVDEILERHQHGQDEQHAEQPPGAVHGLFLPAEESRRAAAGDHGHDH